MVCIGCAEKEAPKLAYLVHHFYSAIGYQSKEMLLAHYSTKPPTDFIQYDGFHGQQPDSVLKADADGHYLSSGKTWELMHGSTVRVLVTPGVSKDTVISLLHKIIKRIDRNFEAYSQQELKMAVDSDNEDSPF
jgi:hypothetical protein